MQDFETRNKDFIEFMKRKIRRLDAIKAGMDSKSALSDIYSNCQLDQYPEPNQARLTGQAPVVDQLGI